MNDIRPASPIAGWIGIDWADQRHEVRLQASDSLKIESFQIEHKPEALQDWLIELRRRFPQGQLAVALEQSKGALLYALMGCEFLIIYPVPPKSLARYREAFHPSGSKSDPADADLLLDMLRSHHDRLHAWLPDDPATRELRLLVEDRRKLVGDRIRLTNRLTDLLKRYFPQALQWAGPLDRPRACEFLERWPTFERLREASRAELSDFDSTKGSHRSPGLADRFEEIQSALPLTTDTAVVRASARMVQACVNQLRALFPALTDFDQAVRELFRSHPDFDLFDSFPGAGEALGPRLLVAFGSDRDRFQDAAEVQRFSGVAPVVERSGKSCWVHSRLACPKFLRQTLHEFAAYSRFWSPWARAYYEQMRSRNVGHHAAVRALAFKWVRVLYRCWKDRVPYNETEYQGSLKRRGSPLTLALAVPSSQ